jgi:short-subunit dehydrogenase involved in D-alanine esterification of teichoic acids
MKLFQPVSVVHDCDLSRQFAATLTMFSQLVSALQARHSGEIVNVGSGVDSLAAVLVLSRLCFIFLRIS